jgi:hypothetical protein
MLRVYITRFLDSATEVTVSPANRRPDSGQPSGDEGGLAQLH